LSTGPIGQAALVSDPDLAGFDPAVLELPDFSDDAAAAAGLSAAAGLAESFPESLPGSAFAPDPALAGSLLELAARLSLR
jgi:hypothetical protein